MAHGCWFYGIFPIADAKQEATMGFARPPGVTRPDTHGASCGGNDRPTILIGLGL